MPVTTRTQARSRSLSKEEHLGRAGPEDLPIPVTLQHASKYPALVRRQSRGRWPGLSFATWNTWGLTAERLRYVEEDLDHDIMVLTELHGKQGATFARESQRFFASAQPGVRDPAAGVGIVLSHRMLAASPSTKLGSARWPARRSTR